MHDLHDKIIVIGHKNPDTDAICAAIAYAELSNQTRAEGTKEYIPCRAGEVSQETSYALNRFGFKAPLPCLDVKPIVCDMEIQQVAGISAEDTQRYAWQTMRSHEIQSLPVLADNGSLEGIITVMDIAMADMESIDASSFAGAYVPVKNLIETLDAKLVCGDESKVFDHGCIVVGAGTPETIEAAVKPGDIVMVGNRYDAQLCAIEMEASCLIVCIESPIAKTIQRMAEEKGVIVINTPYDTYTASRLIHQSIPVRHNMARDVLTFQLSTPVDDVKAVMAREKYHYFPVLNRDGEYQGMISRHSLINLQKKELILVDHNEKSQCVDGFEEANILGIIDHHRLGDIETTSPLFIRSQPVGCTCTIIHEMYQEAGVEIPKNIAGIMLCAILSDTLAFRSPTCTAMDRHAAKHLAAIAEVDIKTLSEEMFEAGEDISGKTPSAVLNTDCKLLRAGDMQISIAQGSFYSKSNQQKAMDMVASCIKDELIAKGDDAVFYIATSIKDQSSEVIMAGRNAAELIEDAFHVKVEGGRAHIDGLLSRKKQFTPALMTVL